MFLRLDLVAAAHREAVVPISSAARSDHSASM